MKEIEYDAATDTFRNTRTGRGYSQFDLERLAGSKGGRDARAGVATLKRAALANTVLQKEHGGNGPEKWSDIFVSLANVLATAPGNLKKIFYSKTRPGAASENQSDAFDRGGFDLPDESKKDKTLRLLQDRFRRVKTLERELARQGGIVNPERSSPYRAEELYYGKAEDRLDKARVELFEPLEKAIAAARKAHGATLEDIEQFLIARHAHERNAYVRKIDPENDAGSGMTDELAESILAKSTPELEAIAERVHVSYKRHGERFYWPGFKWKTGDTACG